jgi:hypothetical protein
LKVMQFSVRVPVLSENTWLTCPHTHTHTHTHTHKQTHTHRHTYGARNFRRKPRTLHCLKVMQFSVRVLVLSENTWLTHTERETETERDRQIERQTDTYGARNLRRKPRTLHCLNVMQFSVRVPVLSEKTWLTCPRSSAMFSCKASASEREKSTREKERKREREREREREKERESDGRRWTGERWEDV